MSEQIADPNGLKSEYLQVETRKSALVEKWSPFINGAISEALEAAPIKNRDQAKIVASMLEQQEKHLAENSTSSGDIGVFNKLLLPTVRRIFFPLIASLSPGIEPAIRA